MAEQLEYVSIEDVRENPAALRDVNKEDETYLGIVDSVREVGILNPIVVRPVEGEEGKFSIVDGLHRFSAACDAGLEEIPVHVKSMEDAQVLETQIIGNIHRVETKPVEYSKQLQRILAMNPTLTANELGSKLSKSSAWINDRLSLNRLHESVKPLVDEGRINLTNAYALAKLDADEQLNWVDQAMTKTPTEFVPVITERKKELDKARREGRKATKEFKATAYLRKVKEIKSEHENLSEVASLLSANDVTDPAEAATMALAWCLHVDPDSVAKAKEEYESSQKDIAEKKEKARAERARQKADRNKVLTARLQLEAETIEAGGDVEATLKAFDDENGLVDGKFPAKNTKKDDE